MKRPVWDAYLPYYDRDYNQWNIIIYYYSATDIDIMKLNPEGNVVDFMNVTAKALGSYLEYFFDEI